MRWWKCGLLMALILIVLSFSFRQAEQFRCLQSTVSLRYTRPLTGEQIATARDYTQKTGGPYITFWSEQSVAVHSTLGKTTAQQITFDGEAGLACPGECLLGRYPSVLESQTCAVSTNLAWALWGSWEVLGLELTADGECCRVVGVFSGDVPLLLRPGFTGFTCAELSSTPEGEDSYRWAERFCADSGLGLPDWILWGPGFSLWILLLPWCAVAVPAFRLMGFGLGRLRKLPGFWRSFAGFGLAFLLALLLPVLLEALPGWLIPTRWSDLSHWQRLGQTLHDRFWDMLALYPKSRDISARMAASATLLSAMGAQILASLLRRTLR